MAEMVASAVVDETVSRISSVLIDQPDQKSSERDDMERLEMAHIKIEAALHLSNRWHITDEPMLRWQSKLKRAAQECDDTLRHCKHRALEDEEAKRSSSFPKRIARAAKLFMSSFTSGGGSNNNNSNVQRFERFAEGTSEFLRFVEFGGTPGRQYMFFNPLIGDLLAGKILRYQALQGDKLYYLGLRSMRFAERGVEGMLGFVFKDFKEPAKSFSFGIMLRLSESSDIFGIIAKCMQSVAATPHFMIAAEDARRQLIQLPTQDISWVTDSPYDDKKYWIDAHNTATQWLRPNPHCCNTNVPSSPTRSRLAFMYPEEVILVYLQCHISLSDRTQSWQNWANQHGIIVRSSPNLVSTPLKLGLLFIPHGSPEGIQPAVESYAFEVIDGKKQEMVHRNACLQDVDEELLPKAMDYLCHNSESRMYQLCLRSKHGMAHLCVEKTIAEVPSAGPSKTAPSQAELVPKQRVGQNRKVTAEAIRALLNARAKSPVDIGAFGWAALEVAALEHEPNVV